MKLPILILSLLSFASVASAAELKFRLTADPATLDWNLARSSHETHIIMNIMEGLVEEGPDLVVRPALAEKWEMSDEGKTYTFFLRPGVKWSDGRALRARDFIDSWTRLASPKTGSSYANFLADMKSAKAVSDSKIIVTLKRPVPHFLHLLTFWVCFPVRLDLIQKYGKEWATPGKLATLGPYLLFDWSHGRSIQLTRNASYFGNAPQIDSVRAVIEPGDHKARELFEKGELDFLLDATTGDLLKSHPAGTRVQQYPYLATYYLGFNMRDRVLRNAEIRRALSLAIDRSAIPGILQGGQVPAASFVPPGIAGHDPKLSLNGGLYEARGALVKAGFEEGKRFPKYVLLVEKFDGGEALGEWLAFTLREKLGVAVTARVASAQEFQAAIKGHKADLFVGHWGADFPDASNFLEVFGSKSGTNPTGWKSSAYDALLAKAASTTDSAARLAVLAQAEKILVVDDVVILPLFYRKNAVLLGPKVKSFELSPLNYLFFKNLR